MNRKTCFNSSLCFAIVVSFVCLLVVPGAASAESGRQRWAARYNGPLNSGDYAESMVRSADGSRLFVTGSSQVEGLTSSSSDYATVAYDSATGQKIWSAIYNGPAKLNDYAHSIAMSADGTRVYVSGFSGSRPQPVIRSDGGSYFDIATIAYDAATGSELWTARRLGPESRFFSKASVVVSPDGTLVYVTGSSYADGSRDDLVTVAYDSATGAQKWTDSYDGPSHGFEDARAIAMSPNGDRLFVSADSWSKEGGDIVTIAYDALDGKRLWVKRYEGAGEGNAEFLSVNFDGSLLYVLTDAYTVVAYDAGSGAQLWESYFALGSNLQRWAKSLTVSPDGTRVYVTGRTLEIGTLYSDYGTIAFDASTGVQLWSSFYNGPGNLDDTGESIVVSPDGTRVYVTGSSFGQPGNGLWVNLDLATVAYDSSNGSQLWSVRYATVSNDYARSIALSPDGATLYVAGHGSGSNTGYDFITIAYDT